MPKVLIDGNLVDVGADALFADDGQTPFSTLTQGVPPTGRVFTEEDVARIREEEKNKLYGQITDLKGEISGLRESVGTLSAAEQQRLQEAEAEKKRLEEAARAKEEEEMDARQLLARKDQEWRENLTNMEQSWEQKLAEERAARERTEAVLQKQQEFEELGSYINSQVEANRENIAPQLLPWIQGNTKEEVDANIARAVSTTEAIVADLQQAQQQPLAPGQQPFVVEDFSQQQQQQPVLPVLPGTRPTGGPGNTDPAAQYQTLTPEQIRNMPMDQFAKLRTQMGIGGQSRNQGMYG